MSFLLLTSSAKPFHLPFQKIQLRPCLPLLYPMGTLCDFLEKQDLCHKQVWPMYFQLAPDHNCNGSSHHTLCCFLPACLLHSELMRPGAGLGPATGTCERLTGHLGSEQGQQWGGVLGGYRRDKGPGTWYLEPTRRSSKSTLCVLFVHSPPRGL